MDDRSRKHRSSSDSLLFLTSARLALESSRADAAERQVAELLSRLRTLHKEKLELQAELSKTKQELELWKIQLNHAQTEILRAQDIVDRVEQARVDAEERADRDRQRARRLVEDRVVQLAVDEGRRIGFKQGLDHGRRRQPARRSSVPLAESSDSSTTRRRRTLPDIPAPPAPAPAEAQGTHQQPPVSVPDSNPSRSPESILPHNTSAPIQPVPIHNVPPTTHDTFDVPPDNYIPTVRQGDPGIILPPPHEWVNKPGRPRSDSKGQRPRSNSKASARTRNDSIRSTSPVSRVRDFAYPDQANTPPAPPEQPRTFSVVSRDSSRISQFELLSPPKEHSDEPRPRMTQPERIVEEWRSHNSDVLISAPPLRREGPPTSTIQRPMTTAPEPARPVPPISIERPTTTDPSRSPTPKASNRSRKPRQVVLPVPITGVFYNPPKANTTDNSKMSAEWLRSRFQKDRSVSNATIPNIDVEPPSHSPTNSDGTVIDPVLLTPEHENQAIELPDDPSATSASAPILRIYSKPDQPPQQHRQHHHFHPVPAVRDGAGELITGILPSEKGLPAGFVPLSPIPSISNLNSAPAIDSFSGTKATPDPPSAAKEKAPSSAPIYSSVPVPGPLKHSFPFQSIYPAPVPPVPDIMVMRTEVPSSPRERRSRPWSPAPLNRPFSIFSDG